VWRLVLILLMCDILSITTLTWWLSRELCQQLAGLSFCFRLPLRFGIARLRSLLACIIRGFVFLGLCFGFGLIGSFSCSKCFGVSPSSDIIITHVVLFVKPFSKQFY